MSNQLKLDMPLPEREDLDSAKAKVNELRAACKRRGWKLSARYRKKQRKFYFNIVIHHDLAIFNKHTNNSRQEAQSLIRQWFPEAYLTSGGFGFAGPTDLTFAERADRDRLDNPKFDSRSL